MRGKLFVCAMMLLFLVSCASTNKIETEIIKSDGAVVIIKSKSDALVKYKDKNEEVEVDNRGRPSFLETILGGWILKGDRDKR